MENNYKEAWTLIEAEYPTPADVSDLRWKDVAALMVKFTASRDQRIAELEKQVEVQAHLIVELRKIEDIAADLRRQLSECKAKARIGQGQEF